MSSVEHTQTNADERNILVSSPSPITPARCPANGAATAEIKPTRVAAFVPLDTMLFVLARTRQPTKVASKFPRRASRCWLWTCLVLRFIPKVLHALSMRSNMCYIQTTHPMAHIITYPVPPDLLKSFNSFYSLMCSCNHPLSFVRLYEEVFRYLSIWFVKSG